YWHLLRHSSLLAMLASSHGPHDYKGLRTPRDRVGQRGIRRLMGQILLACEEPHERPTALRRVVADRPAQHRIAGLECVEDRALCDRTLNLELHLSVEARQHPQVGREHNSYHHRSVWTSTERTDGRSRTMAAQVSPPSADAYTCPPV